MSRAVAGGASPRLGRSRSAKDCPNDLSPSRGDRHKEDRRAPRTLRFTPPHRALRQVKEATDSCAADHASSLSASRLWDYVQFAVARTTTSVILATQTSRLSGAVNAEHNLRGRDTAPLVTRPQICELGLTHIAATSNQAHRRTSVRAHPFAYCCPPGRRPGPDKSR
jgi:hypothetical protein